MAKPIVHFKHPLPPKVDPPKVGKDFDFGKIVSVFSSGEVTNVKLKLWNIVRKDDGSMNLGSYDNDVPFGTAFPTFQPKVMDVGTNFFNLISYSTEKAPSSDDPFLAQHVLVIDVSN
jgi:hypothetical protein